MTNLHRQVLYSTSDLSQSKAGVAAARSWLGEDLLPVHRVEEALIVWEPRIDNIVVKVTADADNGRLLIEASYRVRLTNTFYNLVYPFYLMEGRES